MADLSKIKLNGVEYDLKDAIARPFVFEADWLGYDWEINHDRSGRWFSFSSSITQEKFNAAIQEHKRIILILQNNNFENDDFFFQGAGSDMEYYFLPLKIELLGLQEMLSEDNSCIAYGLINKNQIIYFEINFYENMIGVQYYGEFSYKQYIPILEPMANVTAMLTSFGLNASANLTQAQTGTAETDHAVAG